MQTVAHANPGDRIREIRTQAGISQEALARRAGLSLRTVARIEAGEDTKVQTLAAIADALGVAVSDLLTTERDQGES